MLIIESMNSRIEIRFLSFVCVKAIRTLAQAHGREDYELRLRALTTDWLTRKPPTGRVPSQGRIKHVRMTIAQGRLTDWQLETVEFWSAERFFLQTDLCTFVVQRKNELKIIRLVELSLLHYLREYTKLAVY